MLAHEVFIKWTCICYHIYHILLMTYLCHAFHLWWIIRNFSSSYKCNLCRILCYCIYFKHLVSIELAPVSLLLLPRKLKIGFSVLLKRIRLRPVLTRTEYDHLNEGFVQSSKLRGVTIKTRQGNYMLKNLYFSNFMIFWQIMRKYCVFPIRTSHSFSFNLYPLQQPMLLQYF